MFLAIFVVRVRPAFLSKFSSSNLVEVRISLFGLIDVLVDSLVDDSLVVSFIDDSSVVSFVGSLGSFVIIDSCNRI